MAIERPILIMPGTKAGSDFRTGNGFNSTGQFLFVKLSADNTCIPCTATTDIPFGVSQNNPNTNDGLAVMIDGITKVFVGAGGLVAGDEVGSDNQGKAVKKSVTATGANFGDCVRGTCVEGASAGNLATLRLSGPYHVAFPH